MSSETVYDYAVIGAGISGSAIAHFLTQTGKSVALIDKVGVAGGASGAAGAFLAPKVAKGGYLFELVNRAFLYSIEFYEHKAPELLTKKGLLHSAAKDFEKSRFEYFAQNHSEWLQKPKLFNELKEEFYKDALFFHEGALVASKEMCEKLTQDCSFFKDDVNSLEFREHWLINNSLKAKQVILTTGHEKLLDETHIKIRAILGQRCDVYTATHIPYNLHQEVSVSATKEDSSVTIGATHHREETELVIRDEDNIELLDLASKLVDLKDVKIKESFVGVRAGSYDYLPLLGKVVDTKKTLLEFPSLLHDYKAKKDELVYYPNLYMVNGVGGRGFVLAPYLAKLLSEHLLEEKPLDEELEPSRFFYRECKKRGATWRK